MHAIVTLKKVSTYLEFFVKSERQDDIIFFDFVAIWQTDWSFGRHRNYFTSDFFSAENPKYKT